jgi:phosphatidylglycerol:prolipoprotein diacylglycerol transferase
LHPILLQLGTFRVASYGVMFISCLLAGYLLARRQGRLDGLSVDTLESMWLWTIGLSMLGGRFLFTFVEHAAEYWPHPLRFFAADSGGFSALGSFYFIGVGVPLLCKFRKLPFWNVVDAIAPGLALALSVGKVGCFLAGCCHGRPTTLPWAVTFTDPASLAPVKGIPLHPVQIYEALAWLALAGLLVLLRTRRRFPGEIAVAFFIGFAVARGALEVFRGDSDYIGPLTTYQWLAIPLALGGLLAGWVVKRAHDARATGFTAERV